MQNTPKYKDLMQLIQKPRNFLQNLQLNNIGLKDLIIDDEKLVIGIRQNSYLDVKKRFVHCSQLEGYWL